MDGGVHIMGVSEGIHHTATVDNEMSFPGVQSFVLPSDNINVYHQEA